LARRDHALHSSATDDVVSLSRLTREVVASLIPLFEQQEREVQADIQDQVFVGGDADALCDAVLNIVENALAHGQGTVAVRLYRAQDGAALLDISDEGPGVPAHLRETV